jgi:hypothetical protein
MFTLTCTPTSTRAFNLTLTFTLTLLFTSALAFVRMRITCSQVEIHNAMDNRIPGLYINV